MIGRRVFCCNAIAALAGAPLAGGAQPPYPHAYLNNGALDALVFLPDASSGYYRSVRFDWSGMLAQVRWMQHTFFEPWEHSNELSESPKAHDPNGTGDGAGIAEEFRNPLGFDAARPGDLFVKVGVGLLVRPDEKPYHFARAYELGHAAPWQVTTGKDRVSFVQTLHTDLGFGYVYTKKIVLERGASLVATHELRNTGDKRILTDIYCHDFFQLDGQTAGPGYTVEFASPIQPKADLEGRAEARDTKVRILHSFRGTDSLGFPILVDDSRNEFTVSNLHTSTRIRVAGTRQLASFYLWTSENAVCPEPMVDIDLQPGETARWDNRYVFEEAY